MQNRGLVKFFAILFALVSIYQLSFTFVADGIEKDAKTFAKGSSEREVKYLDSIGKEKVFNLGFTDFTYNEVKDKKINKGLDLEGGINVQLQISVKDIIKGLANNSKNPVFNQAIEQATKNRKGNEDYLDVFFREFDNASKGTVKLASPDIFANKNLGDQINFKMSDGEVQKIIRKKVDESVDSAFEVLRKRIDKFGVTQPNIQKLGESGRILVELPGAKDVDRIKKLLSGTAQLEFWETYKIDEVGNFLMAANNALKATEKAVVKTETNTKTPDTLSALLADKAKDTTASASTKDLGPIISKFVAQGGGAVLAVVNTKDTATINGYFKRPEIRNLLSGDQRYAKFVWGIPTTTVDEKTKKQVETVELYALKGNRDNQAAMSGGVITDAKDSFDQLGKPSVTMQMNGQGAKAWEELTGKAYTQKSNIAIVLDDIVYSAPGVSSGPISGGRSEISGTFDVTQTKDLANVLRAGKLPAAAEIVQSEVVGPSLGQEAIDNGTTSALVGLLIVALWMVVYYGKAGWFANAALLVNLLFLFGILASLGAVLTLPGIAGIVLTMGTAVDANIIIYERAKEELRLGKSIEEAVKASFGWKGAMRSIIDANVTHVLTGAVLLIFGTGPIQGFATTLLIGIATSLFTSIFITRMLLDWSVAKGNKLTFTTGFSKNFFTNFHYDFLGAKKYTYIFSSLVVIVSVISLATHGLDYGVDFKGGRTFQIRFEKPVSAEEVRNELLPVFDKSAEAKVFGKDNQLKVTTKFMVEAHGTEADEQVNKILFDKLKKHFDANMTYDKFVNSYEGKQYGILQASKVGPTVADDIKTNSYWAVLGAMAIVFIYLMVSFRKWQYSLGAIAAVAHDVIFVLGVYSLLWKYMPFGMEIDQHFIAAILTVIGYSMNDTVIVFDRVREYLGGKAKGNFNQIVNQSINSTMSRTINTSLTMILVLLIMFIFGGESIRGFIFAMLIGIVIGTYSSLFIATPVLVDTISDAEHKRIEEEHNREA
ncbi:protein translocase subunit SecDF [Flavobacterium noncentrifugens]|uniref:Multifunctional fusion protein n=1 Tax=Flavobacterium noncentrifugens TaxID=1128970 RepID=A0A1G9BME0_9FLAO|nr:protein translocase subunit SecDF [Flavobacterium noncentrifugens]GEP52302.1 protein translocase subunit SecDF [Flavobacterium noncentrifugens]SDK40627.1 SecD/SecF fusion protein [Flavobacterium noncentrifugens]